MANQSFTNINSSSRPLNDYFPIRAGTTNPISSSSGSTLADLLLDDKLNHGIQFNYCPISSFSESPLKFAIKLIKIEGYNVSDRIKSRFYTSINFWLQLQGVQLTSKSESFCIASRFDGEAQNIIIWRPLTDALIYSDYRIGDLTDPRISLAANVSDLSGETLIIGEKLWLKSGLIKILLFEGESAIDCSLMGRIDCIEESLKTLPVGKYKSKVRMPPWQRQYLERRLFNLKTELKGSFFAVYLEIPYPTEPIILWPKSGSDKVFDSMHPVTQNLLFSQKLSSIRHKNAPDSDPKLTSKDIRMINSIFRDTSTVDQVTADKSHFLWVKRNQLAHDYPFLLSVFILSIQWWLHATDPDEIEEALSTISRWNVGIQNGIEFRMALAFKVLVAIQLSKGIVDDDQTWSLLFKRILPSLEDQLIFVEKWWTILVAFINRSDNPSSLKQWIEEILLASACRNAGLRSNIYWMCESLRNDGLKKKILAKDVEFEEELRVQIEIIERLGRIMKDIYKLNKLNRLQKIEVLRKEFSNPSNRLVSFPKPVPLPTHPYNLKITASIPSRCFIFKSTSLTVLLTFLTLSTDQPPTTTLKVIYKIGDDLRSDASILRLFRLAWDIWKQDVDLELFPRQLLYSVVGLEGDGCFGGLVEFIESKSISTIITEFCKTDVKPIDDFNGKSTSASQLAIYNYIHNVPVDTLLSNFINSCAGYSVLTFIFGIGDRHLDNLLITPTCHLLHIDFSFIFGSDPKPFPPPLKITPEMARAMISPSGDSFTGWSRFKQTAALAFCALRRRSDILLNAISFESSDPSLSPSISALSAPKSINFVKERFWLNLSESDALDRFDSLIEESKSALFPQVIETIHKWAQYWRS